MKKSYGSTAKLFFTYIDSLTYWIETHNIYEIFMMAKKCQKNQSIVKILTLILIFGKIKNRIECDNY